MLQFPSFWHYHPELELTYIKNGQGLRFVGDHIASFASGDLILLGENLPHNWVSAENASNRPHTAYVLQFSQSMFRDFPECNSFLSLFQKARFGLQFSSPAPDIVQQLEALEQAGPIQRLIALFEILSKLSMEEKYTTLSNTIYDKRSGAGRFQSRIAAITSYILDHCDQAISLDEVAEKSGMTPQSFCRWFKQSVGNSFVSYLNTVRVERACQYLLQTDWPISQIAYQTGFESISNFNRTFKRLKQSSPSAYRKRLAAE